MCLVIIVAINSLYVINSSMVSITETAKPSKKIIEFGWDEPDTAFMRKYISEMEKTPFDGCVFHVNYRMQDGSVGNFTWECWGNKSFTEEDLKEAIDDLKNTKFNKFKHNFLRFNVCPGDVDWFDDFTPVINNARLAARIAKDCNIKGILFDIEQYNFPLFNYSKQKGFGTVSWDQYAEQVRLRGRQIMEAFQTEYPDITIFLTFGYCLPWAEMGGAKELSEVSYGLLSPFLDGMLDSALPTVKIVDGYELSYPYKDTTKFQMGYKMMSSDVLKIIKADHTKYRSIFSFGFGIWMDCNWREIGWHVDDLSKNFYTPDDFEKTVRTAIDTADEYIWIYSETPRWWTDNEGKPERLPKEYFDVLRRVKEAY